MSEATTALWRFTGDIFRTQSAEFDFSNPNPAQNPPAGNQFFSAGNDLQLSLSGNTIEYLVPQTGAGAQYYPQTMSNYISVFSDIDVVDCPIDNNIAGDNGGLVPEPFIPNDTTGIWQDPIGDPISLDDYLQFLIINFPNDGTGEPNDRIETEVARVRFALYRWVVHMLANPSSYDLTTIEKFADDDYRRLLIGYYIEQKDPVNADRMLNLLTLQSPVNTDFAFLQRINLKRLFPSSYGVSHTYAPTTTELQIIRTIAELPSENTGYASALYYLYTGEKVYPDFDFVQSQPRNAMVSDEEKSIRLKVSPNPTDSRIEISSNIDIDEYYLYDKLGRLQVRALDVDSKTIILDFTNQDTGIYFLQVKCGSKTITKKVIRI
ncbi:MAG: T9SS type A sorting domain-containing protein [Bacteroidota bacterium]